MAVVIHYLVVQQLKQVPLVGYQDALEAALGSILNLIARLCQEIKEALCRIYLLQSQNVAICLQNHPLLRKAPITVMLMRCSYFRYWGST